MRVLGLLFLGIFSLPLFAAELITQIHDIDYGTNMGDEVLVFLESGHVAKLSNQKLNMTVDFHQAKATKQWLKIKMDSGRFIESIVPVSPVISEVDQTLVSSAHEKNDYVPTTIPDMDKAKQYFKEARHSPKDSQCFNRAMVWTYEWWKNHSLRSNKILVFWSRTYIRRYNFEWWFHIAPYVHVMDGGKVVERAMDAKYSSKPRTFKEWTDIFVNGDLVCPVITKYSDYADHPYLGECWIYRTNMYTYQPADLEMHEAWGYTKNAFVMEEVKGAYLEAFDIKL